MQGRFKRDGKGSPPARQGRGEAAAEQEPRGGNAHVSSPQHTHNQGPLTPGEQADRGGRGRVAPTSPTPPSAGAHTPGAGGGPGAPGGSGPGGSGGSGTDGSPSGPAAKNPTDPGSRMALRNWRISTRLVSLLTLPVVAATALGGLRINESLDRMQQLDHMQLLTDMTEEATKLAVALQEERDLTAGPLANGLPATDFKVDSYRQASNRAEDAFMEATRAIPNTDNDDTVESIRSNANRIATQIKQLGEIRKTAYADDLQHSLTVDAYHRLIKSLLDLSEEMAQATSNPEMIKRTRALAAFSSAKEFASMQRAIIAAALPGGGSAKGTGLTANNRAAGFAALTNEREELKQFNAVYESSGGDAQELTQPLEKGNTTITAASEYADRVLSDPKGFTTQKKQNYLDWTDSYSVRIDAMKTIEATLLGEMESKARELREESQREAIINGALILVVLGVSLVGAFVVARSMIRSLRRLQDTATKVAQERLPELVKQLSESDPQDVDTSVESVGVHSRDEIGKVAAAFDDVHREAVRLAAEQALLRGNVNAMFTNLSRRSQGLIQRQLSLISELESREADPDQLSSLFKLDHLATRMRRNGENLLVLAGEEPGRRWTRPVPLVDVLRAAASEVEQYERIELAAVPATEVAGRVVNDLVHLLAELLENATSFSSPQTKVKVTGHALPDGRVLVEIHDTGIGLSPEDLAAINERLASPPTVDVSVSRRMGLFVVGRLSLRHGIRIQLRPSDSGGTTALVMLPVDVAQGGKKLPGQPGAGRPGMPPGGAPGGRPAVPGAPGGAALPTGGGLLGAGAPPRGPSGPGQGRQGGGLAGAFGNRGAQSAPPQGPGGTRGPADRDRPLPAGPSGGGAPRTELPGRPGGGSALPADAPRGHEDRGPAPAGFGGTQPSGPQQNGAAGGPFVRPDVFGSPSGASAADPSAQFPPPPNGPRGRGPAGPGPFPRTGQGPGSGREAGEGQRFGQPMADPEATGALPRVDFPAPPGFPQSGPQGPRGGTGQPPAAPGGGGDFGRPGARGPQATGEFARPGGQRPDATGAFPAPAVGQGPGSGPSPQPGAFTRPEAQDPA
ncbi:nitrate- and nitrite sensing domain-containing protein, partial [Streptomyces sp. NPDC057638]|uniref:sensor histidine kinase n=1 Tax=Streptomyces sp. NPDC057638 TaxID=3346190 RepID=UPI00368DCFB1